ncbi:hypothetical protein [Burkholderia pseudomallei]|uniref:hypothetical protein n=1 Tax=Burkholderia pseudomallei TaxID=28450 RepID=UPI00016AD186|nr:hypothetical protein [Burkholderia pseudomallei]AUL55416.1 hypothetical protein BHT10_05515 [Burkholderia pseudomallei]MDV2086103.1 hypothetical protein [Burkholderia pseudomallei]MDV2123224.1 hypothetical protein [Burkholderia pseudomallei]MDV2158918.1 hypothetical protein [Burkholderia pseudomallei]MDV2166116.1 hypothetical protein [Burkholderia pseudomallei]
MLDAAGSARCNAATLHARLPAFIAAVRLERRARPPRGRIQRTIFRERASKRFAVPIRTHANDCGFIHFGIHLHNKYEFAFKLSNKFKFVNAQMLAKNERTAFYKMIDERKRLH